MLLKFLTPRRIFILIACYCTYWIFKSLFLGRNETKKSASKMKSIENIEDSRRIPDETPDDESKENKAIDIKWENYRYGILSALEKKWKQIEKVKLHTEGSCGYLKQTYYAGRLGNALYQYAALYGLAKQHDKTPIVKKLDSKFKYVYVTLAYPLQHYDENHFKTSESIKPVCGKCDPDPKKLNMTCGPNTEMDNQFLNPGYFADIRPEIQKLLLFDGRVRWRCVSNLDKAFRKLGVHNKNCSVIGVHSRRGDKVTLSLKRFNYQERPASADYVRRAIKLQYTRAINAGAPCVVTLMFGDDAEWNNKIKPIDLPNVLVMDTNTEPGLGAQTDLCMLSAASHLVLTGGTFTFWAGHLSSADVIIQENNSPSDRLPDWTVLPACKQRLAAKEEQEMPECWPFGFLEIAKEWSCGRKLCYEMPARVRMKFHERKEDEKGEE